VIFLNKKIVLVVYSFHHFNTLKIAKELAAVLDAEIKKPDEVHIEELKECDLIGFGSGIYSSQQHQSILDLIDSFPRITTKKSFIFSTCGVPSFAFNGGHVDDYMVKIHKPTKNRLEGKGFKVLDEFVCVGWNTNSFLKVFGGINKGRPNRKDIERAKSFAKQIITQV
jgi:flavodoxin